MQPMHPHALMGSNRDGVKDEKLSRATIKRILPFAAPYKGLLIGFIVAILLSALLMLVPPFLFGQIIDDAVQNSDKGKVDRLAILIVLAAIAEAVLSFLQRWWQSKVGEGLIFDLRVQLFDHVQRMPLAFFTRTQTGALISRMNNDVIGAQRALTGTLGQVVSNFISLLTVLGLMFWYEWRLTLLSLVILPVFLIPAKKVGHILQALTREQMDNNAAMNTTMTERLNVAGAMVVKLFGRHGDETAGFASRAARVRDLGVKSAVYARAFTIALTTVGAIGAAMIYWLGARMVISGSLSTGDLVALSLLVARVYLPLTGLTNARVDVMTSFVSFDRVFELLDTPNPISDKSDAIELTSPKGAVAFDDVRFTYDSGSTAIASLEDHTPQTAPNAEVLKGVSIDIEPGQLVALVGPSGAGKTTIASLVPRLYDIDSGAVKVDGHDVRDLTQESLRQAIGVVSQDPHLFHDSVGANLRYAKPDATDAELLAACQAAQIDDVIEALPNGLDTVVGERGYRLSGGEKQRLSIARMVLKNPAIVVLDEATSHLDSENEARIQRALGEVLTGRTAIVIAHRLSTITAADQIIVIDDGAVVQRGHHDELIATGGLYSELYTTLMRGDDHGAALP